MPGPQSTQSLMFIDGWNQETQCDPGGNLMKCTQVSSWLSPACRQTAPCWEGLGNPMTSPAAKLRSMEKNSLVPRLVSRAANLLWPLKAIPVTLPAILSRFSFLLIQCSFFVQESLLLNINCVFLSVKSHLAYKTLWNLKTEMDITNLKRGL